MKMSLCNNCPRGCNVDRSKNIGICGVSNVLRIARAGLHFGEEPCISGKNGSGTIFFSGCSLKCAICQNYVISHDVYGKDVSVERLAKIMRELEDKGAHNINFVTPTHYFPQIKQALELYRPNIPLVCNTSGYELIKNIEEELFDVYLFDLKFISAEKSKKYALCDDYFDIASKALQRAYNLIGKPKYNEQGIMQKGIIVRHLILPQSTADAINIIDWLSENTPEVVFSLMSQYVPMFKAYEHPEIDRRITRREYDKVVNHLLGKKFSDVYIQSMKSATTEMIPDFDLTGI